MFTNLYNTNTIEILSNGAKEKLERFAKYMPEGKFYNLHNNTTEKAEVIGLQADGTVVYLSKHGYCSVNPLRLDADGTKNWDGNEVALSTCSCGGTFNPDYNFGTEVDWAISCQKYNESLLTPTKAIVAIYEFPTENDIPEFDLECDVFIIPNSLSKVKDFYDFAKPKQYEMLKDVLGTNGYEYDPEEEILVETWAVGKNVECDNLHDHGFTVKINGKEYFLRFPGRYLPYSLFKGKKEGDVIELRIPVAVGVRHSKAPVVQQTIMLNTKMKLNQSSYRYARFGTFEETLKYLLDSYKEA